MIALSEKAPDAAGENRGPRTVASSGLPSGPGALFSGATAPRSDPRTQPQRPSRHVSAQQALASGPRRARRPRPRRAGPAPALRPRPRPYGACGRSQSPPERRGRWSRSAARRPRAGNAGAARASSRRGRPRRLPCGPCLRPAAGVRPVRPAPPAPAAGPQRRGTGALGTAFLFVSLPFAAARRCSSGSHLEHGKDARPRCFRRSDFSPCRSDVASGDFPVLESLSRISTG